MWRTDNHIYIGNVQQPFSKTHSDVYNEKDIRVIDFSREIRKKYSEKVHERINKYMYITLTAKINRVIKEYILL